MAQDAEKLLERINSKTFLLDEMYKDDEYFSQLTSPVEKYLYYRKGMNQETKEQDGIDIDVCIYNILIYLKCHSGIFADICSVDIISQGGKKWEIRDRNYADITFRGDTAINCFNPIMQIVNNISQKKLSRKNNIEEIGMYLNSSVFLKSAEIESLINKHVILCYGVGNFYLVPFKQGYSLNRAKARLKTGGYSCFFCDDMYKYLSVVYQYFMKGRTNDSCNLIKIVDSMYAEYWIKWFGWGKEGWMSFVEQFCFEAFMDEEHKPMQFWKKTDSGLVNDLTNYLTKINSALEKRAESILHKISDSKVNLTKINIEGKVIPEN